VDRGTRTLAEGGCTPVLVVLGAADTTVSGAVTVHNPDWSTGMGSSVRAGIDAMPDTVDALLVALADQPLVTPEAVRRLVEAYAQGARAAVATYHGNPRNPVLLGREHWSTVYSMAERDVGARPFLRAYSHLVTTVACDDVASPEDIDTEEDLVRLTEALGGV
jgi:CTP:molybdopterin cytidylyltransferase MocA